MGVIVLITQPNLAVEGELVLVKSFIRDVPWR
jgi:hypothetical protein